MAWGEQAQLAVEANAPHKKFDSSDKDPGINRRSVNRNFMRCYPERYAWSFHLATAPVRAAYISITMIRSLCFAQLLACSYVAGQGKDLLWLRKPVGFAVLLFCLDVRHAFCVQATS